MSAMQDPKTENLDRSTKELDESELESVAAGYESNPNSQYNNNYSGPF